MTRQPAASGPALERPIEEAVNAWSRTVFGAPRRFSELVTGVDVRDEVLRRVATQVTRRELRERRGRADDSVATQPRLNPANVDPFAYDRASLKVASEYVAKCGTCLGARQVSCNVCAGDGRVRCSTCYGSGKQRSEKTGRPIKCKTCKAKGDLPCQRCDSSGVLTCGTCGASGHERAWIDYEESSRWLAAVGPPSPIVVAHKMLGEARPLRAEELASFTVTAAAEAKGSLPPTELGPDDHAFIAEKAGIDRRLERVTYQQFHRLAVVRRDVAFEMCGTNGTLVLSGMPLAAGSTASAVKPIRRRLIVWVVLVAVIAIAMAAIRSAVVGGQSAYFDGVQHWTAFLWAGATLLSVPVLGGALRAWRGGFRTHRLRGYEKAFGAAVLVAVAAMTVLGLVVRPSLDEVRSALVKGDTHRAREVIDALGETQGSTGAVAEAEDAVMLAEAGTAGFEKRLELLDQVVARQGTKANDAASSARQLRVDEIRRLVTAEKPKEALVAVERWFPPSDSRDPEVMELGAQAHDVAARQCADDPCRFASRRAAAASATTTARTQALDETRSRLASALSAEPSQPSLVARLEHLRSVAALASKTLTVARSDAALWQTAEAAVARAATERGKVAVIGAEKPVVAELLGGLRDGDGGAAVTSVDGAAVHAVFDAKGRCRGLYVVGNAGGPLGRSITQVLAAKILSQAVGRSVTVRQPGSGAPSSVRWSEGGVRMVARWSNGALQELRVGEAEP